jgi:hypothetical protein
MRTIFGLFRNYEDAMAAVYELRNRGFDEEEMNTILEENAAKNYMDGVNLATTSVDVTDRVGEVELQSIERLIGNRRPVRMPGVGEVYVVGDLANIVVKTAVTPGAVDGGMEAALEDIGVPPDIAEGFRRGVEAGGVLFWIRVDDDDAGQTANILTDHHAEYVGSYMTGGR